MNQHNVANRCRLSNTMRLPILLLLLFLIHTSHSSSSSSSTEIEVDPNGQTSSSSSKKPRIVSATFTNNLPSSSSTLNLYYTGSTHSSSPKLYYGPLEPNGGSRVLEQAYEDSVFVVTGEGGYRERIGEFVLKSSEENVFEITEEEGSVDPFPFEAVESLKREELSKQCRATVTTTSSEGSQLEDCHKCVSVPGCGYSPVRASSSSSTKQQAVCFPSHSIATISSKTECTDLYAPPSLDGGIIYNADTKSVNAWINLGTELMLGKQVQLHKFNVYYGGVGPTALRAAYRCLEMGVERATMDLVLPEEDKRKRTEVTLLYKRAKSALMELEGKLEAVFDDTDAMELLDGSRHEALEDIFSKNDDGGGMPSVPRRTVEEAREYIIRGEPVVITNLFDGGDTTSPVPHKWTLEYLNQHIFGPSTNNNNNNDDETTPKFNIAADQTSKCCRYYEPQSISQKAGYPYPFSPSTHLYRDTLDGFVKTIRKSNRNLYKVSEDGETVSVSSSSGKRVLHYLHEIIMSDSDSNNDDNDGEVVVVAGGPAPPIFQTQIQTTLQHLTPTIATHQPFFGKFASSKLWIGQKNIIMPLHYDSTDNLYVMAWGRKRAIIGEPGQLDYLYRYPNQHPLAGSSQVNLTKPDLTKYPNFKHAKLQEVIVGPGDVLYLPAWWWHQFEQPFEDTAALNVWSVDREQAPDASMRDVRVRELLLADQLEGAVVDLFGVEAGVVLEALAATTTTGGDDNNGGEEKKGTYVELEKEQKDEAMKAMYGAANSWRQGVTDLSGITPKASHSAESLVKTYLSVTYKEVMKKEDHFVPGWRPGDKWDLSRSATLPRDLRERCEEAPESSPFMSICA